MVHVNREYQLNQILKHHILVTNAKTASHFHQLQNQRAIQINPHRNENLKIPAWPVSKELWLSHHYW
jgi:hypothetical protein